MSSSENSMLTSLVAKIENLAAENTNKEGGETTSQCSLSSSSSSSRHKELKDEEGDEGKANKRPSNSSLSSHGRSSFKRISHSGEVTEGEIEGEVRKRPSSLSRLSDSPRKRNSRQLSGSSSKRTRQSGKVLEGESEGAVRKRPSSLSRLPDSPGVRNSRQLSPSSVLSLSSSNGRRRKLGKKRHSSLRDLSPSSHRSYSRQNSDSRLLFPRTQRSSFKRISYSGEIIEGGLGGEEVRKRPASLSRLSPSPSPRRRSSRQLGKNGNRPSSLSRLPISPSPTRRSLESPASTRRSRGLNGKRPASLSRLPVSPSPTRRSLSGQRPASLSSLPVSPSPSRRSLSSRKSKRRSSRSRSASRGRSKSDRSLSSCNSLRSSRSSRRKSRSSRSLSRAKSEDRHSQKSETRRRSHSSIRFSDVSLQTVHSDEDENLDKEKRKSKPQKQQAYTGIEIVPKGKAAKSGKSVVSTGTLVREDRSNGNKRRTICIIFSVLLLVAVGAAVGFIMGTRNRSSSSPPTVSPTRDSKTDSPMQLVSDAPTTSSPSTSPTRRILFDPPNPEDCLNMANGDKVAGQDDMVGRNFTIALSIVVKDKSEGPNLESSLQKGLQENLIPKMADCPDVSRQIRKRRLSLATNSIGGGSVEVQCLEDGSCSSIGNAELCYSCLLTLELMLKDDSIRNLDVIGKLSETMLQEDFVKSIGLDDLLGSFSTLGVELGSPTDAPTPIPSQAASMVPSNVPSVLASSEPTRMPTDSPTNVPTKRPTNSPTKSPTRTPTKSPTLEPAPNPTPGPTLAGPPPTDAPTRMPSHAPSFSPTDFPTVLASSNPSNVPSVLPSRAPSEEPSSSPSMVPSTAPSMVPSSDPSVRPSEAPSESPSARPSTIPTPLPSRAPSSSPSKGPSVQPSALPSRSPSSAPSASPAPSVTPSASPTIATFFWVACGSTSRCGGPSTLQNSNFANIDGVGKEIAVRCCSDTFLPKFQQKFPSCPYADSEVAGTCYNIVTHHQATAYCKAVGARLCTKFEVESDCSQGTGCQHDRRWIWTSTPGQPL